MIWLLNASVTVRRSVAVGILVTILLMLLGIGIAEHVSLSGTRADIGEQRQFLGSLIALETRLSAINASDNPPARNEVNLFLSGQSESVMRANLQQGFKAKAARSGVEVVSVGSAPDSSKGGASYVGIQANITAKTADLLEFLISLETTSPILLIPRLTIRSTDAHQVRQPMKETPLVVQIQVYGALNSDIRGIEDGNRVQ